MPKYLIKATLSVDGAKGLLKEGGTARRKVIEGMAESVGGRVESVYWAFGEPDAYVTVDLPNNVSAAAIGLAVSAAGSVRTNTVVLLTADEIDEATKQKVNYRPLGQ